MSTQQQPLRPLNDEIPRVVQEPTNIIDLSFCQWRYSWDAVNAFNKYYKEKGSKKRMPEYLTQWQRPESMLN